jgi:hypothetical protein
LHIWKKFIYLYVQTQTQIVISITLEELKALISEEVSKAIEPLKQVIKEHKAPQPVYFPNLMDIPTASIYMGVKTSAMKKWIYQYKLLEPVYIDTTARVQKEQLDTLQYKKSRKDAAKKQKEAILQLITDSANQ